MKKLIHAIDQLSVDDLITLQDYIHARIAALHVP